jgi:hypothetical protein
MHLRITASLAGILLLTTLTSSAAPPPGSVIALVDGRNQKWVSAENGTSSENLLIADVTTVTDWERFVVVDAGNGQIGLRCQANSQYVCAEGAGTATLRANRSALNSWEKFTWIDNADGSASLVANANGKYVSSQAEGLIANRTAINAWEKFSVLTASSADGFASVPALGLAGTSGGAGGQTVTVTTRAQLISYGTDNTPRILQIPEGTVIDLKDGTVNVGTTTVGRYNGTYYCGTINDVVTTNGGVSLGSNKTVVGLGGGASLIGAGIPLMGRATSSSATSPSPTSTKVSWKPATASPSPRPTTSGSIIAPSATSATATSTSMAPTRVTSPSRGAISTATTSASAALTSTTTSPASAPAPW